MSHQSDDGPITRELAALADQVPLVEGRVLLELANGLTVASALTAERQRRGTVSRIVNQIIGRDSAANLMTLRGLIDGQQALLDWLAEVSSRGAVTDLALALAAGQLAETQRVAAAAQARGVALSRDLRNLSEVVAELAEVCAKRLGDLDAWRAQVTAFLAAQNAFDTALERWQAGRSYAALHWPYQVLLLAREVAGGPCGRWDAEHGPEFTQRLTDRIVAHLADRVTSPGGFVVARLLEESAAALPQESQRQLIAEVLDAGLGPSLALPPSPLTTAAALTMELAALSPDDRPPRPGGTAVELARRRVGWLDGGATLGGFVAAAVGEQMEMADLAWQRLEIRDDN